MNYLALLFGHPFEILISFSFVQLSQCWHLLSLLTNQELCKENDALAVV